MGRAALHAIPGLAAHSSPASAASGTTSLPASAPWLCYFIPASERATNSHLDFSGEPYTVFPKSIPITCSAIRSSILGLYSCSAADHTIIWPLAPRWPGAHVDKTIPLEYTHLLLVVNKHAGDFSIGSLGCKRENLSSLGNDGPIRRSQFAILFQSPCVASRA